MNVLITGAEGQLGKSIEKISAEYPDLRFVFTDLPEWDITNAASVERLFEWVRPDVVVNCAAYTAVERAEMEPEQAYKINTAGVKTLAEAARRFGARLIHISTDYVFDGSAQRPYTEVDTPNPQSVYGRTKLAGEQAVRASGANAAIVRTSWLYSEFGNNFVKSMLRLGASGGEVNVVNDQTGSPTYAGDLAHAIIALARHRTGGMDETGTGLGSVATGVDFEIYHYCNAGVVSRYEFAREIFRLSGYNPARARPLSSAEYQAMSGAQAPRPHYSALDTTKITAHLGLEIPRWEDSLRVCLASA
jgi:dTDP-4-dehydrorhamnose reductase